MLNAKSEAIIVLCELIIKNAERLKNQLKSNVNYNPLTEIGILQVLSDALDKVKYVWE